MTDRAGTLPMDVAIVCVDAERTIRRTLGSVRPLARRIVVLDSGSTDATIDIARSFDAEVRHQDWLGHVRQKQTALEMCDAPWVLALDSDESLTPRLAASVRRAIERDDGTLGYEVNRKVWWAGRFLEHAWQPEWRLRLVRNGSASWAGLDPHDALEPVRASARTVRLEGDLRHDTIDRGLHRFLVQQMDHGRTSARAHHDAGRTTTPLRLATSPAGAFLKQLVLKRAFLDGWRGWCAASSAAAATLAKHACLLELTMLDKEGEA